MKPLTRLALCLLFFLLHVSPAMGQKVPSETGAVRQFVQGFYDWYTPIVKRTTDPVPPYVIAIRSRRSDFTTILERALARDWAEQKKVEGYSVGLEYDPFINAQDTEDRYEVGKVRQAGRAFMVEVHGVAGRKVNAKPDVVAKVVKYGGKYRFENFLYPDNGGNLLSVLKGLAADRKRGGP